MKRAFSLIEVLIVIAVIAVLAGFTYPVMSRSKVAAKRTVCLSNLRNIGTGTLLYVADADDFLPAALDPWTRRFPHAFPYPSEIQAVIIPLYPYIRNLAIFECPLDVGNGGSQSDVKVGSLFDFAGSSYRFPNLPRGFALSQLDDSSKTMYARDNLGEWHEASSSSTFDPVMSRVFLDGHANHKRWAQEWTFLPDEK